MSKTFTFKVNKKTKNNLVMYLVNQNLSISFFVNLLRITEITWSIFSLVVLKDCKTKTFTNIIWIPQHFYFMFWSPVFTIRSFALLHKFCNFFLQTCLSFTISITWSILWSFLLGFTDLCLQISHNLILQSY